MNTYDLNEFAPKICPEGTSFSTTFNTCVSTTPTLGDARYAFTLPQDSDTSYPMQLSDAKATITSAVMGTLNILTIVGAVGGLAYLWSKRNDIRHKYSSKAYWKGRSAARKRSGR